MKYQVSFSLINYEKVLTNVVCCSLVWRFEGGFMVRSSCNLKPVLLFFVSIYLLFPYYHSSVACFTIPALASAYHDSFISAFQHSPLFPDLCF